MCDYSLMMFPNRLATMGEELVAHRFRSGTTGFVSCSDFQIWQANRRSKNIWQWLTTAFSPVDEPKTVVCIPPGARLRLEGCPEFINSDRSPLGSHGLASFTELSAEANHHRDALRFDDGVVVFLGMLAEGQRVRILRLSSSEESEETPATPGRAHAG